MAPVKKSLHLEDAFPLGGIPGAMLVGQTFKRSTSMAPVSIWFPFETPPKSQGIVHTQTYNKYDPLVFMGFTHRGLGESLLNDVDRLGSIITPGMMLIDWEVYPWNDVDRLGSIPLE